MYVCVCTGVSHPISRTMTPLQMELPRLESLLSRKVRNIVRGLRLNQQTYPLLTVVKEDSRLRGDFLKYMVS